MESWFEGIKDWISIVSGAMTILGISGLFAFRRTKGNTREPSEARKRFIGALRGLLVSGLIGLIGYWMELEEIEEAFWVYALAVMFISFAVISNLWMAITSWIFGDN